MFSTYSIMCGSTQNVGLCRMDFDNFFKNFNISLMKPDAEKGFFQLHLFSNVAFFTDFTIT